MNGELAVLAWIVTVMVCLGTGALVWRRTRPLGHSLVLGGRERRALSQWLVWAPSSVLLVTGGVVAFRIFGAHQMTLKDLSLDAVMLWLGICVFMQVQTLFAMRKERD
ncbi:hypothetical protein ASD38_10180 [Caulobacter sp. Root487D2Y]|uniref:hypothetical protein n=1 Tax=Caulobacter sp. Root487D2Y TaxID=1736547 RepID=UPI0006F41AA1|nr:hypothetical protein [Caulobacter sp. Root487D2Y]KQY29686.1 hypothetical protein ASD38_10180 [Caulobacter sp. Root487D2Y]